MMTSFMELYENHRVSHPFMNEKSMMESLSAKHDYRGFCLLIHPDHGLLMLQCSKPKPNKPSPHLQLPGGHIDNEDFDQFSTISNIKERIYMASKIGCAREVYEETGIELRQNLDRLLPIRLFSSSNKSKLSNRFQNEHKHRLFFLVLVSDSDFPSSNESLNSLIEDTTTNTRHLKLQLSSEHTGFTFEQDPQKAIGLLKYHSGGKVSQALQMAFDCIKEPCEH